MTEKTASVDLKEHHIGPHFMEKECGAMGKVVSALEQAHGLEKDENIHIRLLATLQETSLETLLDALKKTAAAGGNQRESLTLMLHKKPETNEIHTYQAEMLLKNGERTKVAGEISLPAQRAIITSEKSSKNCCDLVEDLLGTKVLQRLEYLIIRGRGVDKEEPLGLLEWLERKHQHESGDHRGGESVVHPGPLFENSIGQEKFLATIKKFRKDNKGAKGTLILSQKGLSLLLSQIGKDMYQESDGKREIVHAEIDNLEVWLSYEMPSNIGAIINKEEVYLVYRRSAKINNWWNYRETINLVIGWKYRYACNLVVRDFAGVMRIDMGDSEREEGAPFENDYV